MDPLTIATTTGTIIRLISIVSWNLYTFMNDAKNIDQNFRDLAIEVNSLQHTLREVGLFLKSPDITQANERFSIDDGDQLWTTLYACLQECETTISRLDDLVRSMERTYSNWLRQSVGQFELNLKQDEVNSLRTRIHTHCAALSMSLQMINIRATYMGPEVVIDDLAPKINRLQQSLDLLTNSFGKLSSNRSTALNDFTADDSKNMKSLYTLGARTVAKASTIYASSVCSRSVFGERLTQENEVRIADWIPISTVFDQTLPKPPTAQSSEHRPSSSIADSGIDVVEVELQTTMSEPDIVDSDSEAEFELEVARRMIDMGRTAFESTNYEKAASFMQKAVAIFNRLPYNLKSELDLTEVPLIIATCKIHLNEIEDATKDLTVLIHAESLNNQDAIHKCQVSHLLSQICLINNDFETAEKHCRDSLNGRRRLLGKGHRDWYASIALLSEICRSSGKSEEAAVLKAMLPQDFKKCTEMRHLKVLKRLHISRQTSNDMEQQAGDLDNHSPVLDKSRQETIDLKLVWSLNTVSTGETWVQEYTGSAPVGQISFSPDGSLLASASSERFIRIWDLSTDEETSRLVEPAGRPLFAISKVSFSPDGSLLAIASCDEIIHLWDSRTGKEISQLFGHTKLIYDFAFSPSGSLIVSASQDKTLYIWNSKTGRQVNRLGGHTGAVYGAAFSSDGCLIVSASEDKTVRMWDSKTAREIILPMKHAKSVNKAIISPNGLLIASTSSDKKVWLWDAKTGQILKKLDHKAKIFSIAFSPDSSLLASAGYDQIIYLWDPIAYEVEVMLGGYSSTISVIAFSPDGKLLASGSHDQTVSVRALVESCYLDEGDDESQVDLRTSSLPDHKPLKSIRGILSMFRS